MLIAHPNKRIEDLTCQKSRVMVRFPGNDRLELFPFDKIFWVSEDWYDNFTGPNGLYGIIHRPRLKRRRPSRRKANRKF